MADPPDATVTSDTPLQVTDTNKTFNKVTVEVGGIIMVKAKADPLLSITTLIVK